jgi:beta-glucosidase
LPADQQALIEAAIKLKKRIILVVNSGAGVDLAPFAPRVDAIIQAWYPGQEGAAAIADIITGSVNPSGKLATSFPKTLKGTYYADAYPPKKGHVAYTEDLLIGYRWFDTMHSEPLYPFGFGLSYTTFAVLNPSAKLAKGTLTVTAKLKNTGKRSGADVIQAYIGPKSPAGGLPLKELKAFQKVSLAAGGTSLVTIHIPVKDFAHWDTAGHSWHVAKGQYVAYVGDSSRSVTPLPFTVDKDLTFAP